ncbi:MAG: hypothetical protein ACTSWL_07380 [Promethearchaeota archaeon]
MKTVREFILEDEKVIQTKKIYTNSIKQLLVLTYKNLVDTRTRELQRENRKALERIALNAIKKFRTKYH